MSRLAVIWTCYAALMGFALGGSFVSSIAPTSEIEKQRCYQGADAGHYKADECKSFWERSTTDPVAFYTLGLFVFTGVLAISTALLWDGGEKQRKLAADTAERQLRAYVAIKEIKFLYPGGEWQPNILVCFHNFGQTPAYSVESVASYFFQIVGEPTIKELGRKNSYLMHLAPTQEKTTAILIPQSTWNPLKEAVAKKGIGFFVHGEIHYTDAFGIARRTKYRLQLDPDDDGIKEDGFTFCAEGNEAN